MILLRVYYTNNEVILVLYFILYSIITSMRVVLDFHTKCTSAIKFLCIYIYGICLVVVCYTRITILVFLSVLLLYKYI